MLADPTDYGHVPGDGPLRPGGQSVSELPGGSQRDKDLPSTPSKAAKRQAGALQLVRDLWGGTESVRAAGEAYLPRHPGEDPREWRHRLQRSVFFNAFRRTVEGLVGLVFRKDVALGDDVPPRIQADWENIDLAGTHGDVFARDLLQEAVQAGHVCILVEFPDTGGAQDAGQELPTVPGALRPYWVPVKKDDIVSWRSENVDGRTVLSQVVIRETACVPDGLFGEREQTLYRVLKNEGGRVSFQLLEVTKDKHVIVHREGAYRNQEEIPLAEVTTSGRVGLLESTPPLLDLAYLNVAHYQQWSDYATSLHMTCVPILFTAGVEVKDESGDDIVVGPNTALASTDPNAKAQYVSHDGAALGSCKEALDDLKADMGALGLAMLAPQKRTAETAEAKRLDKATQESSLAVTARGLQDAIERALGFHARYLRLPSGGSCEVNRDFESLLMDAPVMQAFATLVESGFPTHVVLKALQQGGRIPEDEDLEALEMEWLASMEAERVRREEAAQALAERAASEGSTEEIEEAA